MIDRLVDLALGNRLLALALAAALVGAGTLALRRVPIDAFPDVTPTMVQVFTKSPGLSPEDVETLVSYPVAISMYGLPGLERVQSTSIFGLSRVNVYFEEGTGYYFARRLVTERLEEARQEVPPGLGEPQLGPITTGLGRVFMYTLESEEGAERSLTERRTVQDWIVKPMLRTVPGVTDVLSAGGFVRQYQVRVDPSALAARGLTLDDLRRAVAENNRNVGGSFLERGGEEHVIRGYGWLRPGEEGLSDLRNVVVAERSGTPVYLRDVAEIGFGRGIRRGALVANGKETVGGFVLRLVGTNTQQLLERLRAKVGAVQRALPEGLSLEPYYSQGELVERATGTVRTALVLGASLVVALLYLFIGSVPSTLIVVASLPLSVLVAFLAMAVAGMSANLMSLGGLAIAIGVMVDGSVVMVENIVRRLEERRDEDVSILELVRDAAHEVARPVAFAVAIVVAVFLPLFTLQGVEGKMFSPMAYTICFALGGALLVALTLVPVLATLGYSRRTRFSEPRIVGALKRAYRPALDRALRRPATVAGAAGALFAASLALFPFLGSEFVPTLREGTFQVRSTLPAGANLDTAIEYAKRIQAVFGELPEVEGSYARVGRAEVGSDPAPVNVVATVVDLKPLDAWESGRSYEALQSELARRLEETLPGLANNVSQPIQLRTEELLSGVMAEVVVSVYGEELDRLADLGEQVAAIARDVPGAVDVRRQQQGGKPQVVVRPDREALARHGISVDGLLETVETGVGGEVVGQVFEGVRRFDVFVRLEAGARSRIDALRQLPIRTAGGALLPLSRLADVETFVGPKKISRAEASRRIVVQLNVRGRDMGSVVEDLRERVRAEVELPPGSFVEYGGQFESQRRAMRRLYVVVPITLAMIVVMLVSAFSSARPAALIFLNVPFALTGGLVALAVSGQYLSVPSAVGFIAVFGVAVENGLVLVSSIEQLRGQGVARDEAVRRGAERRLRPVLMTALTGILGLVPLLLAGGIGANVQRPLATVVVGGLVTSTLLTLFVLPAVYRWFAEPRGEVAVRAREGRRS